jgi:hypothetical protein
VKRQVIGSARGFGHPQQREDLGVLDGVGADEQRQPVQHANERQVGESKATVRDHAGLTRTEMLRSACGNVLIRGGVTVLGTHRLRGADAAEGEHRFTHIQS